MDHHVAVDRQATGIGAAQQRAAQAMDEQGRAPSRTTVQTWIQGLWEAKDREISEIKARYKTP